MLVIAEQAGIDNPIETLDPRLAGMTKMERRRLFTSLSKTALIPAAPDGIAIEGAAGFYYRR